jgi:hypothetical protein
MVAGGLPSAPVAITTTSAAPVPIGRLPESGAGALPAPAALQLPPGGATIVNVADQPDPAPLSLATADAPTRRILPVPKPAAAPRAPAPRSPAVHLPPAHSALASSHPALPHASPKRHLPAVKPVPVPAAVDTDVALISAIIQHAAGGHESAPEPGCADKACGPRMPTHP